MNEVKIAPCPYCGGECYCEADNIDDKMQECPPYWIKCKYCHYQYGGIYKADAITDHNAFCALIEKGREWDELFNGPTTMSALSVMSQAREEYRGHLETAVRLLGEPESKDTILAARWRIAIANFLALDAIKAILKQKGQ